MSVRFVRDWREVNAFLEWIGRVPDAEWLACDVETDGLDPWGNRLKLVQFGTTDEAWALPYPQMADPLGAALGRGRPLVGWNSKFDEQFLRNNGYNPNFTDDAKFMANLLFSEQNTSLKPFSDAHLGGNSSEAQKQLKAVARKLKVKWFDLPNDTYELWFYGGVDTMLTARAAAYLWPMVEERGYAEHYELELEVWHMVTEAEQRGICVDMDYCREQYEKLEHELRAIETMYPGIPLVGTGSKLKLIELFEGAGVKLPTTPRGNPKLDEKTIKEIDHPIADDIIRYRKLQKNSHTYFGAFQKLATPDDEDNWRIHTTLKTMEARTGRMSSSIPNLQNVPKRVAGAYVRRAFMASPGHTLVLADFQQIEYRIFAAMAGEQGMIDAFLDGKDMHAVTAELALGHAPTEKERDMAKNGNFTELYLGGLEKFADTAEISMEAARRFKTEYHRAFPRIKPFTRALIRWARANGYAVTNAFGRRIGVDHKKPYVAVNYNIQGTAADALKRGLRNLSRTQWIKYLVLLVHDEYVLDVPNVLVKQCVSELPAILEDHATFSVPLTVEVSIAKRWGEPIEIGEV